MLGFVTPALALSGLYLVCCGQASPDEVIAAATCGMLAAGPALAVRLLTRQRAAPGVSAARTAAAAVASSPREAARVAMWLMTTRRPAKGFEPEPRRHADRADSAVEILAASFAPNRYVVDMTEPDRFLMHTLVP